ncbi:DUF222 domain-containing protein [Sinomonas sp. ASV486]|uniref:HNH endonuclease n=1 Tax=Sinomonas sp. ASV486 TaxID=3051170 RepID=UPI0027DD536D|nr:DUF222 domain-containing protein [Sinomonas sp. ASV486]MDQ4489150.1 DUF222 domain-containing protein [Sinomonas sp. ASV486]
MDRFTGSAHDGGWSPRNVGAPALGPVPEDSWASAYPWPSYLDDPAADPGRADFDEWAAEAEAQTSEARIPAARTAAGLEERGSEGFDVADLEEAGALYTVVDANGRDVTGFGPESLDPAAVDPALAEELPPAALRAELRVRRVEMLVGGLSRHQATEAQIHADRARDVRRIAILLGAESEDPHERVQAPSLAAAEVAAELSLPPRAARALVAECLALTETYAAPLLAAMDDGELDRPRAQTILRAAVAVPVSATLEFMTRAVALAVAGGEDGPLPSLPALQCAVRRLAQKYSSETFEERARIARDHRRVDIEPADDGMCHLSAWLPLEDGAAIDTRLQAIARNQPADDPRTVTQARLDAFTALLLALTGPDAGGGAPSPRGGVRTELVVTVPLATVVPVVRRRQPPEAGVEEGPRGAGVEEASREADPDGASRAARAEEAWEVAFDREPGEILGYGLISAAAARRLAARASTWLRMLADPDTGEPLALGRSRYTPPPVLRRQIVLRDANCRFPACDRPSAHTEVDHTLEWARGGSTELTNLALLCPEHHRLKTIGVWNAEQGSHGGTITWTSPLGRTHVTTPGEPKPPPF